MGADSTLVNAAFKLAQTEAGANVPNMAPLMQAQVGISAGFANMARVAMTNHAKKKETQRVSKSKKLNGFEKIFTDTLTKLYEQEEPLPEEFIDVVANRVEALQADFEAVNTYGGGDTSANNRERARIMGELKRVTNEVVNFRGGLEKFGMARKDGLLNKGECAESDIAPAQQAMDMTNFSKNAALGKVEVGYGEDGKLQITSRGYYSDASGSWGDDVVVTINSLEEAFPTKNLEQDAGYLASFTESEASGKTDASKPNAVNSYDAGQRHAEFKATLNTDAAFQNIVSRKIEGAGGNNASFKDALLSDINIPFSILDNMFYDDSGERVEVGLLFKEDLDVVKDGVINQKDYDLAEKIGGEAFEVFETNLDAMIDVITNVNNSSFDLDRSADMVADYLLSMDQEKYAAGFNAAVKSKNSGKSGNYNVNGREMTAETFEKSYGSMVRMINNPKEGDVGQANGINFMYQNGKYYAESTPGNFDVEKTQFEVATDSGLLNYTNVTAPSLDGIDLESSNKETEKEIEVSNTKPSINGVVYPSKTITSSTGGASQANIKSLMQLYHAKYGVTFTKSGSNILMTGPDGETQSVEMNRYGAANNMESQDIIQQFVLKYVK